LHQLQNGSQSLGDRSLLRLGEVPHRGEQLEQFFRWRRLTTKEVVGRHAQDPAQAVEVLACGRRRPGDPFSRPRPSHPNPPRYLGIVVLKPGPSKRGMEPCHVEPV
jgi:hypothetical protein